LPYETFYKYAEPWIDSAVNSTIDKHLLCSNLHSRCEVLSDIPERIDFIDHIHTFDLSLFVNKKQKVTNETSIDALALMLPLLKGCNNWSKDILFDQLSHLASEIEMKVVWLTYPLGVALSGKTVTPGGGVDIAVIIGKQKTIERIEVALERLRDGM
jgi:glutamyl-tRNA synthetase